MKYAFECPTCYLDIVQPLADFNFILAHLYLEDSQYRNYFSSHRRSTILDNSIHELGSPIELSTLTEIANELMPDLICPPDYRGDCEKTLWKVTDAVEIFGKNRILPVLQGSTKQELSSYASKVEKLSIARIAVPATLLSSRKESLDRLALLRYEIISDLLKSFKIVHLLGTTNPMELQWYGRSSDTRLYSVDTGEPIKQALADKQYLKDSLLDKQHMLDYTSQLDSSKLHLIGYNIGILKGITK